MAKILINYSIDSTGEYWSPFEKIGMDTIQTKFKDNNENDIKKVVTSVPSPFAQMHLYDSVFGMVAENPTGNSIHHRLVSKCLDLMEIVFNYHTLKDQGLKITKWNKDQQLDKLKNSGNEAQRLLAETLELYTSAGKIMANESNIYMFLFENRVIGGTSPFTLLFPTADISQLKIANTTGHHYFDENQAQPLYAREQEFQEFMYKIFLAHNSLTTKCKNLYKYIENQPKFINDGNRDFRTKMQNLKRDKETYHANNLYENDYEILRYDNRESVVVYNNIEIPTRRKGSVDVKQKSDFVIKHNSNVLIPDIDNPPLVLMAGFSSGGMKYTQSDWKSTYEVPLLDENTPLSDRILPIVAEKYPYLTINDFLESHLLALPYNVQTSRFHIGKVEYETGVENSLKKFEKFNYLCPLKKKFFDYFEPKDIESMLTFSIKDKESVRVSLTIPIKKGKIIFEKYYYYKPSKNDYGTIIKININIGIFPFYKMMGKDEDEYNDFYKVMFIEKQKDLQNDFKLDFYYQQNDKTSTNQKSIPKQNSLPRVEDKDKKPYGEHKSVFEDKRDFKQSDSGQNTTFFQVNNTPWDYIEVTYPNEENDKVIRNLIIPKWVECKNGYESYQFGVDFGTTNTYIAYTKGSEKHISTFTIEEKDMQMITLNEPDKSKQDVKEKYEAKDMWNDAGGLYLAPFGNIPQAQFVPSIINDGDLPMRTSILVNTRSSTPKLLLSNINILFNPYLRDGEVITGGNKTEFNLKWTTGNEKQNTSVYLEELLRLIRNKVALIGGNINNTNIYWSAPLSMQRIDLDKLCSLWNDNFRQIFKSQRDTYCLSEAYAPYRYLQANELVPNEDLCNIDIGGGTTDVFFNFTNGNTFNTSFRFAGDTLWGEGFNEQPSKDNPFLQSFKKYIDAQNREDDAFKRAKNVLDDFSKKTLKSNEIISLCFKYDEALGFLSFLGDCKHLRVQLLIHYASIVYHLAEIIKFKNINIPRYFVFTGMGSKYIQILDPLMGTITEITKAILSKVSGKEAPTNFQLVNIKDPKQATAKGCCLYQYTPQTPVGILYSGYMKSSQSNESICWLGQKNHKNNLINQDNIKDYKDITADVKNSVAENVVDFINMLFTTSSITKHLSNLGIQTNLQDIMLWWAQNKEDGIKKGLHLMNQNDTNKNEEISETLFFYEIKEKLYQVGKEIYNKYGN
ncbi:MAG: hypothetical protein EAZ85_03080 [Bacteroidetes bacterium]|nr:MAG: hypothetical protein EAZ85_03080 [Bacteroidota bacterium]